MAKQVDLIYLFISVRRECIVLLLVKIFVESFVQSDRKFVRFWLEKK